MRSPVSAKGALLRPRRKSLGLGARQETSARIEVLAELVVDHPVSDTSLSEERHVATRVIVAESLTQSRTATAW